MIFGGMKRAKVEPHEVPCCTVVEAFAEAMEKSTTGNRLIKKATETFKWVNQTQ